MTATLKGQSIANGVIGAYPAGYFVAPGGQELQAVVLVDTDGVPVSSGGGGGSSQSTVADCTAVTAQDTQILILAANANRKAATFVNTATYDALYLKFVTGVTTTSYTVKLGPGDYYEMPQPVFVGAIYGVWSNSGSLDGNCLITELS